jgi:hypothetical protein
MELATAEGLIKNGVLGDEVQSWADLGAGSGLFTKALSNLLPKGSSILAIDKTISKIDGDGITVLKSNFLYLNFQHTDGVIMANSLHYVKDQEDFLHKLSKKTKQLILVEYDTDKGNQWVPYPISFKEIEIDLSGRTKNRGAVFAVSSRRNVCGFDCF